MKTAANPAEKITGTLWLGIGGILSGLILFMSTLAYFQGVDNAEAARDFCLMLPCGVFWFGNASIGFFLMLGKHWARVYVFAGTIGITVMGFWNAAFSTFWFPAGFRAAFVSSAQPILAVLFPFPRLLCWALAGIGLITVCALICPQRVAGADPS